MKITQFRIGTKIFLPIGITLTAVIAGFSWYLVSTANTRSEQAYRDQVTSLAVTSRMMIHSGVEAYVESHGMRFYRLLESDPSTDPALREAATAAFRTFREHPDRDSFNATTRDSSTWMVVLSPARMQSECRTCHSAFGMDQLDTVADGSLAAVFGVAAPVDDLLLSQARTRWMALGASVVVLALLWILITRVLNATVLRPLNELAVQSEHVARGDLRVVETPELERRMNAADEMGVMARAFAGMVNGLREIIGQVRRSAESVSDAGSSISSTTEQLAAGAMEQSSQTNEVASAVEEMTRTILENSKNAAHATETAREAQEAARRGGAMVSDTVGGMHRIAEVVRTSARTVEALGKSSDQIGAIAGVIDDIADQTNLLALNAAIEAARAGDQGRGFAVVADEVRKLAERTTSATSEIATMIRQIQTDTQGAIGAMHAGVQEVEAGIAAAAKAGTALEEIVAIAERVTDVVTRIAAASEQQSTTAEQIAKNVQAISTVSQESANGTQQIARTADNLKQLTVDLQTLVARFQLTEPRRAGQASASPLTPRASAPVVRTPEEHLA